MTHNKTQSKKNRKSFYSSLWFKISITVVAILLLFFIVIIFIPVPVDPDCFKKISGVEAYAKKLPEFPAPDNTNLVKPDYTSFYKSRVPGLTDKFKYLFSLCKAPFSAKCFKKFIDEQVKNREQEKLEGNFIYKYSAQPGMKIVIFGDVQGAFHSLLRDLVKLRKLEILNDDFSLKNNNDMVIFMGDAISRSAYSMETLILIIRLLKANPQRAFYLRGSHESNKYWEQHSLKLELDQRAEEYKDIVDDVNRFFNTLPLGIYLKQNEQFVRISPWSYDDEKNDFINESLYSDFLIKDEEGLQKHFVKQDASSDSEISLRVVVKSQKKRKSFQIMDGLRMLPPERGAMAWTLLASPTISYIKLFKYIHDSFSVVEVGKRISSWIITKYSRSVIKKEDFYHKTYNFLTGKELTEHQVEELQKMSDDQLLEEEKDLNKKTIKTGIDDNLDEQEFEKEDALGLEETVKKKRKKVDVHEKVDVKSKNLEKMQAKEVDDQLGFVPDVDEFEEK